MKFLLIIALCFTETLAMPQGFPVQQFPDENFFFPSSTNNDNNVITSTTAAPATTSGTATTASPQFLACLQSCPSTMEYNPVCGTDNQNYHNNGRLSCAQRCGKNVAAVRSGICTS